VFAEEEIKDFFESEQTTWRRRMRDFSRKGFFDFFLLQFGYKL
jgi:hypothetical protein